MSIKNFGLMWERNGVQWSGVRGNAGHLSGFGPIGSLKREQHDVDFREQSGGSGAGGNARTGSRASYMRCLHVRAGCW